jgi:3alpha(or 20beta)-hydroxysteroid dehydrogenase
MHSLEGKTAIITGAARGQGGAEARLFIAEGANVVLTDVNPDGAALATQLGSRAHFMVHDVADAATWEAVVATAVSKFSRLDILVNNAGVYRPAPLRETDQALWDLHYRVNQLGVFLGMRSVVDAMVASGGGSIINVSSNAGMKNVGGIFAYATSKWAVRGMSKLAATELAPSNIRVNSIYPGIIDTPMLGANDADRMKMYQAMIPLGRLGSVDEVSRLVAFLASDSASYITGAEITVDGGIG